VPLAPGQTVNFGVCTPVADLTATVTVTPALWAFVLQTQTAKLASPPGFTFALAENDCTWTHSCGVFGLGDGEVFVGLGDGELFVGLGDGEVVVGLGDGGGLELGGELVDGDGSVLLGAGSGLELAGCVGLVVGLVVGPDVGPALGGSVGVELGPDVVVALALASVLLGIALALACVLLGFALAGALVLARATCASSVAVFGTTAHAAFAIGPVGWTGPPASAAYACPSMLVETKAKPVRAPTTAGRTRRCALTPDLTSGSPVAVCPGLSILPTLGVVA
jgi:hypothetical protein